MVSTVTPRLSELIGPWVCSDNRKVQSKPIHLYTEPCSITLIERTLYIKYSNRAVIATVRITESSVNQWPDNRGTTVVLFQSK